MSAQHLKPLVLFLVGTGARLSEALELQWRDVDLTGARAIFWRTKNGRRRNAKRPPSVVAALSCLKSRSEGGMVFRRPDGKPYADKGRESGGQICDGFAGALRRAGLDPEFTPHTLRHTWASWRYAIYSDLLLLKVEGGWHSTALCERYAHLLPEGHEAAIRRIWHVADTELAHEQASA